MDDRDWVQETVRKGFLTAQARWPSVPGRGCTIWYRKKLMTRLTITYEVLCPAPKKPIKGLQPRDINNFWLASDPVDPDQGLFDAIRYTGAFKSYDKMNGYYASTGGGGRAPAQGPEESPFDDDIPF